MTLTGFDKRGYSFSLFDGLSDDQTARMLHYMETQRFFSGDVLIVEGAIDRTLYIVTRGEVNVVAEDIHTGAPCLLVTRQAGTPFGEMAFFDKLPRSASILAATDGELLQLRWEQFQRMRDAEPDLALALVMELGRKVSVTVRQEMSRNAERSSPKD